MSRYRIEKYSEVVEFLFNSSSGSGYSAFRVLMTCQEAKSMARDTIRILNKDRITELEAEIAKLKAETP